jgi:hypothetical protein
MAAKRSKKKGQESIITPLTEEKTPLLEAHIETLEKQKRSLSIPGFSHHNTLLKLRIVVITLFVLLTLAILLIFANGYMISAVLILLGYILLFILMVKLFLIKKL